MTFHWVLQENVCQERKWDELIEALKRTDTSFSIHKIVPFSGELIPPIVLHHNNVFCYGSISMGNVAKQKGWKPGVLDLPIYETILNSPWKNRLLNNNVKFLFLWQIASSDLIDEELYFIKPNDDSKFIPGQIMSGKEIKEWAHKIVDLGENDGSNVNKDSIVIVSNPKNIRKEARFWIIDDNVVTWSLYKLGRTVTPSRLLVDDKIISMAYSFCSKMSTSYWRPADAYCLDICEVGDNDYKIVEINNINSSGLYDCDPSKIVYGINDLMRKYDRI